jgi:hypothetical protein
LRVDHGRQDHTEKEGIVAVFVGDLAHTVIHRLAEEKAG